MCSNAVSEPAARKTKSKGPEGGGRHGSSSAAAHTYDKGYARWEKFDVDAALAEDDDESSSSEGGDEGGPEQQHKNSRGADGGAEEAVAAAPPLVTPATITADASR